MKVYILTEVKYIYFHIIYLLHDLLIHNTKTKFKQLIFGIMKKIHEINFDKAGNDL